MIPFTMGPQMHGFYRYPIRVYIIIPVSPVTPACFFIHRNHRRIETLDTPYGAINVKIAAVGEEIVNVTPEYDDCKRAALEQGVPLKQVIETVRALSIRPDHA